MIFIFLGPTDLEMKTDTTSISVSWNDAILPNKDAKIAYKLTLRYEGILISNGAVVRSKNKEPVHKYSCQFSDLWTGTSYTLTILTITDDQAWDPPIVHEVKTKKGIFISKVIIFKTKRNALICVVEFSIFEQDVFVKHKCTRL